jgi:Na+/H+ antiporter NhaB
MIPLYVLDTARQAAASRRRRRQREVRLILTVGLGVWIVAGLAFAALELVGR